MHTLKATLAIAALALSQSLAAGGLLTNTNQNIAFLRNPARDAAIGIDGVYSNPAGVAFLKDGIHLSINLQNVHQTRTVTTTFAPFATGAANNGSATKEFEGTADAPVLPSLQAAYNKNGWSFQFNFAVTGGGGKCVFDNGLPSFESTVGLLPLLSGNLDALTTQLGMGQLELPTVSGYRMSTYMRGRQYYYGFTLGAARRINEHWSVYGGLRLLYGTANYYGHVSNIEANINNAYVNAQETFLAGASQAYTDKGNAKSTEEAQKYHTKAKMLEALGSATGDVSLNCNQTGWGIAPIVGVDFKTGNFNFAAKYEFKTRMKLDNSSANSTSAANLAMLNRFQDGISVDEDSPALLTIGAQWTALPELRLGAGWHHYFDKNVKHYNNHQEKLGGNTNEWLFGAEYDITKSVEASAGVQLTRYQMTDEYMEDISFNVSSYSFGFGVGIKLTSKLKLNVAYFQTNYETYDRESNDYNGLSSTAATIVGGVAEALGQSQEAIEQAKAIVATALTTPGANGQSLLHGKDSFTRTNRVIGIGLDITL